MLILNLHDDDQALSGLREEAVRLAPPHAAAVAKAPPLGWEVKRRPRSGRVGGADQAGEVVLCLPLIANALRTPARVAPISAEERRHIFGGVGPVNLCRRPEPLREREVRP